MRFRIEGKIIEKTIIDKINYNNEIYSMVINHFPENLAKKMHSGEKFFRLFSFSRLFFREDMIHFYITGDDKLIERFIEKVGASRLIRIGDMVINLTNISQMPCLPKKEKYLFKSKVIANFKNEKNRPRLIENIREVEEELVANAKAKAQEAGIEGAISIDVINPTLNIEKYKQGNIFSWKCMLMIKGDYDIINYVYNVGLGLNTSTGNGHGMLVEVV